MNLFKSFFFISSIESTHEILIMRQFKKFFIKYYSTSNLRLQLWITTSEFYFNIQWAILKLREKRDMMRWWCLKKVSQKLTPNLILRTYRMASITSDTCKRFIQRLLKKTNKSNLLKLNSTLFEISSRFENHVISWFKNLIGIIWLFHPLALTKSSELAKLLEDCLVLAEFSILNKNLWAH